MVHLLSRGYVLPVVGYIRKCLEKLDTDISLIRYFVTEVSNTICFMFLTVYTNSALSGLIKCVLYLTLRTVLPGNHADYGDIDTSFLLHAGTVLCLPALPSGS